MWELNKLNKTGAQLEISNKDRLHLNRAISVARTSTERQRHGCVVVKGGRVISVGVNTFRNHPLVVSQPDRNSSYHAEINAMRGVDLTGATLYVARLGRNELPSMSAPCVHCTSAIIKAGAKRIVWTVNEIEVGKILL